MRFDHPDMQKHKMAGFAAAAKSNKTPAHLRAHQSKLAAGQLLAKAAGTVTETQKRLPNLMVPPAPSSRRMMATEQLSKSIKKQTAGVVKGKSADPREGTSADRAEDVKMKRRKNTFYGA